MRKDKITCVFLLISEGKQRLSALTAFIHAQALNILIAVPLWGSALHE
jgi:hypothetical protein